MAIGMTYDEYWKGPPRLAEVYRKSLEIRRDLENERAWWQGYYVLEACLSAMSTIVPVKKAIPYPDRPHDLSKTSEETQADRVKK